MCNLIMNTMMIQDPFYQSTKHQRSTTCFLLCNKTITNASYFASLRDANTIMTAAHLTGGLEYKWKCKYDLSRCSKFIPALL